MNDLKLIDFINRDGLNSKEQGDLILFDYSQELSSNFDWDLVSLNARGIVFNKVTGELVARPFSKFFNYEELRGVAGERLPESFRPNTSGPFRALEKIDGSCAITYKYLDKWYVNTRGSFASEQAIWATEWLNKNLKTENMNSNLTYLFEIIYPANRIVVDYGKKEALVLIGVIDKETGNEFNYNAMQNVAELIECEIAKIYEFEKFEDIFTAREMLTANEEGWVVTFDNGYKCKIKGEEYLKVHRILSSVTPLHFWRAINLETFSMPDIEETILLLPDEFQGAAKDLVKVTIEAHQSVYNEVVDQAKVVPEFPDDKQGKKDKFFWIRDHVKPEYANLVLNYLGGNKAKLRDTIHRMCRPTLNTYANVKVDPDLLKRLERILQNN